MKMLSPSLPIVAGVAFASALLIAGATAQSTTQNPPPSTQNSSPASGATAAPAKENPSSPAASSKAVAANRYRPQLVSKSAREFYALFWGVESLSVKAVESGEIIRFSYRVLNAEKARMLNDKKNEPSLIDPAAGVRLVVPSLEKVGQLRQSGDAEDGKTYWMAFSNKGRYVKPGHRVNVVIGNFHAEGLIVQ